ncbi:MAG: nucleotidyltransferase family protein [Burkholderiales bacterium]
MKAMILAAGRGERMRPLTDRVPKPLLSVGGKPLIEWHVERLAKAGFDTLVINHAHLGKLIESFLGDGRRYGVDIFYSAESEALETAGGIANALPHLGQEPFAVVNGDIFCDYDFRNLATVIKNMRVRSDLNQAHLVMVDNPAHHPVGDFSLADGCLSPAGPQMLTFSGIGLYRPELFRGIPAGSKCKLIEPLRFAMTQGKLGGEYFSGKWVDVGTPERLKQLDEALT